jgi:hypothetical protein
MLSSAKREGWKLPERVFVCGAIPEVLALAKGLTESEFVVLDSSPVQARSLRTACSRRKIRNVRIETGTVDQEALPELVGGNFDLVLAPGALRGLESIERAMENLSACTAADGGALYFELDAAHHPSSRSVDFLSLLPNGLEAETARRLEILAAGICGVRPHPPASVPGIPARCWPLRQWLDVATASGLHLASCTLPSRLLPLTLPFGGIDPVCGLDLVALCRLLEAMTAPRVLQAVFSRRPMDDPPWTDSDALAEWRPSVQFWPRDKVPVMEPPLSKFMELTIDIPGILEPQKLQITAFLLEFLRLSDGQTPVRRILDAIPHPAKTEEVLGALFFFHHTCILRLLPPIAS